MKKTSMLKRINALLLATAVCVQTIGAPLIADASGTSASIASESQKVFGQIAGEYDAANAREVITLDTQTLRSDVTIKYITLPDGTQVQGNSAWYSATSNGTYAFSVVYDEIKIINNENGEGVEYVLSGEQGFRYEVTSLGDQITETETETPQNEPADSGSSEGNSLNSGATENSSTENSSTGNGTVEDNKLDSEVTENNASNNVQSENNTLQSGTLNNEASNNETTGGTSSDSVSDDSSYKNNYNNYTSEQHTQQDGVAPYTTMTGAQYKNMMYSSSNAQAFSQYTAAQEAVTAMTMNVDAEDVEMISDTDIMVITSTNFTFNASTKTITAYTGSTSSSNYANIIIPAQIDGVDVEQIASNVFYGKYIETVTFETGSKLKTIGSQAFRGTGIKGSVTLPSTVTYIGTHAFYQSNITDITIPGNVTSIETYTFYGCTSLLSVTITGNTTSIGTYAFYGSTSLARVSLPETVQSIGAYAFRGCTSLVTINYPSSLSIVDVQAFYGCTSLMNANFSSAIRTIGNSAFYGCTSLTSATFEEGLTSIGTSAFYNTELYKVILPATLQQLGASAFRECSSLIEVTFKGNTSSIGSYVFTNASKLAVVNFLTVASGSMSTSMWGGSPLYVWAGYIYKDNFILDTSNSTVITFVNDSRDTQEIPAEFEDASGKIYKPLVLADSLFLSNTTIVEVSIPDTVTSIGYRTFYGCTKLAVVNMPEDLVTIGAQAFYNCQVLTEVRFGNKLQSIGNSAFYYCYGLGGLNIPDNVTSIGTYAFYGCKGLSEVTIGTGVKTINNYTFAATATGNSSITVMTIKGAVTSVSTTAFTNSTTISQIYFTGSTSAMFTSAGGSLSSTNWGATKATVVWSDTSYYDGYIFDKTTGTINGYNGEESVLRIPEQIEGVDVLHIASKVFYANTTLTDVYIPDTVLTIGSQAFYRCTKLRTVEIGTGITTIGANAFNMYSTSSTYTSMTSMTIHGMTASNSSISASAFTNFPTSVVYTFTAVDQATGTSKFGSAASVWGGAVTSYPSTTATILWADSVLEDGFIFDKSTGTIRGYKGTELVILVPEQIDGADVKIIGPSAFYANTTITDIVFPDTLETISTLAFYRCKNLRSMEIGSGIHTIGANAFNMYSTSSTYTSMSLVIIHGMTADNASIAGTAFTNFPSSCSYYFTNVDQATGTSKFGSTAYAWGANSNGFISWCDVIYTDSIVFNTTTSTVTSYKGSATNVVIPDFFYREYAHDPAETLVGYAPTAIADSAFASKTTMTTLYIPNSVTAIGNSTFSSCTALQTISGGEGIKTIGNYAFRYNYALLNAPIFNGLETIGIYAFSQCNGLTTVILPDSVTSIGNYAFYYCSSLRSMTFGSGITDIPQYAVAYHSSYSSYAPLQEVYIYGALNSLNQYAFRYQYQLLDIIFENVAEGDITGFPWGASSSKASAIYGHAIMEDGYVFNATTGTIVSYRGTETSPTIPSSIGGYTVTAIGASAFASKTTLYEVTIPDTVTSIGSLAFSGCTALTKVTIEGDTESAAITIGTQAFYNCSKITEMYINGPVTQMASNALSGASTLATIHFKHITTESVSGYASRWGSSFTSMTIAWAETIIQDGFIFDTETLSVTGYVGSSTSPNMPEKYYSIYGDEYTVTAIANDAFKSKTTFTAFNMPDTVTAIGDNAFYGCTNIVSMVLSKGLKSIGDSAFYNNTMLIGITLPDTLETIGSNAFYNANKMTNVIFGSGLTTIGYRAFYYCTSLESLVLGENVKVVGSQAFYYCTSLQRITFTGEVNSDGIGSGAFSSCSKLEFIQFYENTVNGVSLSPWGATNATVLWKGYVLTEDFVFDGINKTLIKYIGSSMEVIIPDSFEVEGNDVEVETIGTNAFYGNTKMMSLVIPDTVKTIGESAFYGCTALAQISFGNSIEIIEDKAFQACSTITKINLPESVRLIGASAFASCTKLEEIVIPGDIEVIATSAFSSCSSLEIIYIPRHTSGTLSGSPWSAPSSTLTVVWSNLIYENGFIYDIANETIIRYVGTDATINVPEVFEKDGEEFPPTYIGEYAFQNKTFITKIVIPDTVEEIAKYAFSGCTKLVQLSIGDGVKYIGDYAFYNCPAMTTLTIGESVQEIGTYAFHTCTLLKELVLPDTLEEIGAYSFYGAASITELVISDSVRTIGERAFYGAVKLMDLTIGDSVTDIYGYAFYGCIKLSTITWGAKISNIWTYAFYNALNLSELILPSTVNFIDSYAFAVGSGNTNILTEIEILSKISSMDVYAFRYRTNVEMIFLSECEEGSVANSNWGLTNSSLLVLWSNIIYQDDFLFNSNTLEVLKYRGSAVTVTIPSVFSKDGVDYIPTSISASAMSYNTTIQSITIPASIKDVGTTAFRNNTNLKEVIFIGEMHTIGTNAFLNCTSLQVIYLPQNEEGSITGSPWGASTSITTILWSNYVLQSGFIFDISTSEVFKYIGSDSTVVVPSVFTKWVTQSDDSLVEMTYRATKISDSAFLGNTIFKDVTISEGITEIGNYAFARTTSNSTANTVLAIVTFPSTLEIIGVGSFRYCTALITAELPANLITIGSQAFEYCSKLALREIGNAVKTIGTYAFRGCTALVDLSIGNSVTTLGEYAFYDCDNLQYVTVGTGITTVGNYAFAHCAILASVTFLGDLNTIGLYTFRYSYLVETIYIPQKLEGSVSGTNWSNGNNSAIVIWKDIIYTGDYLFNTTTGTITKYYGTQTTVVIPKTFTKEIDGEEYTFVTQAIGASAFQSNTIIQSVTVPDSVTDVGSAAFRYCTNLKDITFQGKMNTIGTNAFGSTTNLKIISLQENEYGTVTGSSWGNSAGDVLWSNNLYASDFIYDIDTKAVIKYIGSDTVISVPSAFIKGDVSHNTEVIGDSIFYNKTSITKVTLPDTVTTIEYRAFRGCTYLTEIVLSANLTTIGAQAFYSCQRLHTAKLPATLETMGTYAFYNCYVLGEVVIGDSLNEVPAYAYYGCYTISKLEMGSGVKTIGEYAFYNTNALTEVTLGTGVTAISANAFNNASNLAKLTIPSNISTIGAYAFRYCNNLVEIHIPQKDNGTVTGSTWSASYAIVIWRDTILTDEYIYSITDKAITKYRGTSTNVIVPSSFTKDGETYEVESIGTYAFASNSYIMKVTLPETLKWVDTYAFASSSALSEIIFTSAIDSVGYRGFYNLSSIKVVVFPENYEGTVANQSNWALSSNAVIVWKNLIYLEDFVYDIATETITKYVGTATTVVVPSIFEKDEIEYVPRILGASIFQSKSTIVSVSVAEGIEIIDTNAFRAMTKLKTVILPSTLTTINGYAFYGSTAMTTCTLPSKLSIIEEFAFYNCDGLTEVTLPANMERVGNSAFRYCDNILKVTLEGKIDALGTLIFANNTKLNTIDIQEGVETIGEYMFSTCQVLRKAILPSTVTTIQNYAFASCRELAQISVPEATNSIASNAFNSIASSNYNPNCKIYIDQYKATSTLNTTANTNTAWGAGSTIANITYVRIYWRGDSVKFTHTVDSVVNSNNKVINISAIMEALVDGATELESVTLPDGTQSTATDGVWSGTWPVSANGTYVFIGNQTNGESVTYEVEVTTVGNTTISAQSFIIEADARDAITVAEIISLSEASVVDDAGNVLNPELITISADDINEVKAMTEHNQSTMVTLSFVYTAYNTVSTKEIVITLVKGKQILIYDHNQVSQGAYWMEYGCSVNVYDKSGSLSASFDVASDTTSITLPEPDTAKDGYSFSYWNLKQGEDQNVSVSPVYVPDVKNITFKDHEGVTLGTYEICVDSKIYIYNKESEVLKNHIVLYTDTEYQLDAPATVTGFDFSNWQISKTSAGDITVTPIYTRQTYDVKVVDKDGEEIGTYTIAYESKVQVYNHTDSVVEEHIIEAATTITLSDASYKTGHTFAAWAGLKEATGNVAIKPTYTVNSYQVTIKDASGAVIGQPTVEFGKKIYAVNENGNEVYSETVGESTDEVKLASAPEKEGYSYSYWEMSILADGNIKLIPHYTINEYTITFQLADETEISSYTRVYGDTMIVPTAPAQEGQSFAGWDQDVPTTVPAKNAVYTAVYTNNLYALTFYDDDGSTIGTTKLVEYDSLVTAPTPTKEGYTFSGWSPSLKARMPATDTAYTATYQAGTGNTVTFLEQVGEEEFDVYTTRVMTSGEVVQIRGSIGELLAEYNIVGDLDIVLPTLYMEGHTLKSWQFITNDGVLTVQPVFEARTYTITFKMPDGSVVQSLSGQEYGAELKAPSNPTLDGYVFSHWSPSVPSTVPASNATYTAQFTAIEYKVTFYDRDGGSIYSTNVACGSSIPIPTELIPTVEYHTFVGWSPSVPKAMPAYDLEFTAQYVYGVFDKTIEIYSHAGDYVGTVAVNVDDTISVRNHLDALHYSINITETTGSVINLDAPTVKEGYTFSKWALTIDGDNHYTLTPQYEETTYTATFYDSLGNVIGTPQALKYGAVIQTPSTSEIPTVANKEFAGWSPLVPSSMPENNMNFTATYLDEGVFRVTISDHLSSAIGDLYVQTGAEITIKYGEETEEVITIAGSREIRLNEPDVVTGYLYDTWQVIDNGDNTYTVEPLYKIGQYTMTFMVNGTIYHTETLTYGEKLTAPTNPVSTDGKTFAGWLPLVPGTVPAQDTVFVANFSDDSGILIDINTFEGELLAQYLLDIGEQLEVYDENDEEIARRTVTAASSTFTLPEVPVKEGYTFTGWTIKKLSSGNVSATLTYSLNSHTLTFLGEGGNSTISQSVLNYGAAVVEPENVPVISGKTFSGWTPSPLATIMPDQDLTYTATYIDGVFNIVKVYNNEGKLLETLTLKNDAIVYLLNEFGNEMSTQTINGDTTINLPAVPAKEGYNAQDWIISTTSDGNANIQRNYSKQIYTITFVDSDGTTLSEETYEYGDTVVEPSYPTSGGVFGGWDPDFSSVATADMTYYAQYYEGTSNAVTVNFYDSEGNFIGTKAMTSGKEVVIRDNWGGTYNSVIITQLSGTVNITLPEVDLSNFENPDDYALSYWDLFQFEPGEEVTANAVIEEVGKMLTFLDASGDVIQEGLRAAGRVIIPPELSEIPTIEGKTFSGWTPTLAEIMPDIPMTYTATYTDGNYHVVTIQSAEGTTLGYKLVNNLAEVTVLDEEGNTDAEYTITTDVVIKLDAQEMKEGYSAEGFNITQVANGADVTIQQVYKKLSYELTFKDHDGSTIATDTVEYAEVLASYTPADPTRSGYTFMGWSPTVASTMPAKNTTYTATYVEGDFKKVDIYTSDNELLTTLAVEVGQEITVYHEDGSVLADYTVTRTLDKVVLPEEPEVGSLTFIRWDVYQASTGASAEITAVYEGGPFDVTFYDEDGETVIQETKSYAYGANMDIPVSPTKEGYTFAGWLNTYSNEILDITNRRVPSHDTEFTASYEVNKYTVTFEDGDGNLTGGALASQSVEFGAEYQIPESPVKDGYVFTKWVIKDSDPEVAIDMDNLVMPAEDITYEARYEQDTFTITYYADIEPSVEVHEAISAKFGADMPAPSTTPEKEGYKFIGWDPIPAATVPAENVFYRPVFAEGTGNVITIYDHEGNIIGSGIVAVGNSIIVNDDEEYSVTIGEDTNDVTIQQPTIPEGHSYDGWTVTQEKPDADIIITPQFTLNQYTISFVDVDDSPIGGDLASQTLNYGDEFQVPDVPSKAGYVVDAWVVKDSNPEVKLDTENLTVPANNVVYVSSYSPYNYPVIFKDESGNVYEDEAYNLSLPYQSEITPPEGMEKDGYTFVGWEDISGNVINADTTPKAKVPLDGIIYMAKYAVKQYDMVFYSQEYMDGQSEYTVHETLSLDYQAAMEMPTTNPSKSEHTFMGWTPDFPSTVPNETLEFWPVFAYGIGESIKVTDHNGAPVGTGYIMVAVDNQVIIKYDEDGINNFIDDIVTITIVDNHGDIQLSEPAMKEGYSFDGWDMSQESTGENVTYTPKYSKQSYTMSFVDQDGNAYTEEGYSLTQEFETSVTVPNSVTVVGYDFAGWVGTDGSIVNPGDTDLTMPAKDTVYKASYKIKTVSVTYYDEAGEVLENLTVSTDYNSVFAVAQGPSKTGYTFTGWKVVLPSEWESDDLTAAGTVLIAPAVDVIFQAQYEINSYTVRFEDYNQSLISEESQDYASTIDAPEDPTREGYTFFAWVPVNGGANLESGVTTVQAANVTYVASYKVASFNVVYYGDEEGTIIHYSKAVEYATAVPEPSTDPIKVGCTFMGWDGTIPATMPASDLAYYPIFVDGIQDTITITDHNGKLVQRVIVDSGNTITAKYSDNNVFMYNITTGYPDIQLDEPPTITGHVFSYWMLEQAADGASVVLTPQYVKEVYTIKFFNYNGELYGGEIAVQVLEYGDAVQRPVDPTRAGYTFTGWTPIYSSVATGDVVYTATYSEGEGISVTIVDHNNNFVGTYAVNIGNKIDQYDNDENIVMTSVIDEETNSVKLNEPLSVEGYVFQKWEVAQSANGNIVVTPLYYGEARSIQIVDNDSKVLAEVTMNVGNNVYQLNGDGEIIATIPIFATTTQVKAAKVEDKTGHTFTDEWDITKDENGDYTISPIFSINSYQIIFVDYDNWIMQEQVLEYDTDILAPSDPIRLGYTFVGWTPALNEKVLAADVIYKAVYDEIVYEDEDEDDTDLDGNDDGSDDGNYDGSDDGNYDGSDDGNYDGSDDGNYDGSDDGNYDGSDGGNYGGSDGGNYDGFNDGYSDGYNDGFNNGSNNGNNNGYNDGNNDGYNNGYNDGNNDGYNDGSNSGSDSSYSDLTGSYGSSFSTYNTTTSGGLSTIPDMSFVNNNNMDGILDEPTSSYTDRTNNGFLNTPEADLHLYHLVFMSSGILAFVLMFSKRRMDETYGNELLMKRIEHRI